MDRLVSVANRGLTTGLTRTLSSLDATLTSHPVYVANKGLARIASLS
jgi:hypothetical protein